ncbi:hypothetical protein BC834DRAFT_1000475 [Gloeopeniophorella convolvens]|nr:hypothetical protein BC834DRAFT_1000475 [Gloeopeniophorella convolvens]
MTTPPEPTATLAKPPFDDLRTDLILRANDGVEFHVFKNILSLCSTVFADMFDIAQSESQESSHDVPVVNLSEDSKALDYALRQCYPIQSPEVIELSDARNLLEFTRKYQINMLENTITHCLSGSIAREPVGVYAIAVTYGYKDLAVKAMQSSLKLPVSDLHSPELRFITAEQYQALLRYHIACGKAASAVSLERKWFPSWSGFIAAAESSSEKDRQTQEET